jgi:hypothetical protein
MCLHEVRDLIAGRQRATAHETLSRWLAGDHSSNNEFYPKG